MTLNESTIETPTDVDRVGLFYRPRSAPSLSGKGRPSSLGNGEYLIGRNDQGFRLRVHNLLDKPETGDSIHFYSSSWRTKDMVAP